jgi:hypothetical protein
MKTNVRSKNEIKRASIPSFPEAYKAKNIELANILITTLLCFKI